MRQLFLMIFMAFVALTSCQKRAGDTPENPNAGITLQLTVPESSVVQTKAQTTDEKLLNNLWVFVFDNTGTLKERSKTTNLQNTPHTAQVNLEDGTNLDLYFAANVTSTEQALFNAFQDGVTTLAELKAITTSRAAIGAAPGFATLAEAEASFPQNVDYNITVIDADARDLFVSNGQYYLGVSNSAFVTYTDAGVTGATITTVTHNAPSSITEGTITVKSGSGVTLKSTKISTTGVFGSNLLLIQRSRFSAYFYFV